MSDTFRRKTSNKEEDPSKPSLSFSFFLSRIQTIAVTLWPSKKGSCPTSCTGPREITSPPPSFHSNCFLDCHLSFLLLFPILSPFQAMNFAWRFRGKRGERERGRNDVARWGAVKNWHLFTPSPFLAFFLPILWTKLSYPFDLAFLSFPPSFPKWLFLGAPVTNINAHLWKYTTWTCVTFPNVTCKRWEKGREGSMLELSIENCLWK